MADASPPMSTAGLRARAAASNIKMRRGKLLSATHLNASENAPCALRALLRRAVARCRATDRPSARPRRSGCAAASFDKIPSLKAAYISDLRPGGRCQINLQSFWQVRDTICHWNGKNCIYCLGLRSEVEHCLGPFHCQLAQLGAGKQSRQTLCLLRHLHCHQAATN